MACASTVAVVVPSPATSEVFEATSFTICAPMFSNLFSSSISFATVTPSLVMRGAPNDFSMTTLRPFGPSVTFTALARTSTPRSILSRASCENLTSFAAMFPYSFPVEVIGRNPLGGLLLRRGGSLDDSQDVAFLHHEELFSVDHDLGPRPFAEQDAIARLHVEWRQLAAFI